MPLCIRQIAKKLLLDDFTMSASDKYPPVEDGGLPQPTAFQFLCKSLSSIQFPAHFAPLARILRGIDSNVIVPFKSQVSAHITSLAMLKQSWNFPIYRKSKLFFKPNQARAANEYTPKLMFHQMLNTPFSYKSTQISSEYEILRPNVSQKI